MKKGRIYSLVQEANSSHGGWPKKSKLALEERVVAGLTIEDAFSKVDGSRSDVVDDVLGGFGFDSDDDEE